MKDDDWSEPLVATSSADMPKPLAVVHATQGNLHVTKEDLERWQRTTKLEMDALRSQLQLHEEIERDQYAALCAAAKELGLEVWGNAELAEKVKALKDVRIPCEHVDQDIAMSRCPKCNYEVAKAGLESLRQQLDAREEEIARLKRGDFTPEEFQALCHNRNEMPGCTRADFEEGCRLYQKKLFGE